MLDYAIDRHRMPIGAVQDLHGKVWDQHAILFARHVTHEQWETVALAYAAAHGLRYLIESRRATPDQVEAIVRRARDRIDAGALQLLALASDNKTLDEATLMADIEGGYSDGRTLAYGR